MFAAGGCRQIDRHLSNGGVKGGRQQPHVLSRRHPGPELREQGDRVHDSGLTG